MDDEVLPIVLSAIADHGARSANLPAAPPPLRFSDPIECPRALDSTGFTDVREDRIEITWYERSARRATRPLLWRGCPSQIELEVSHQPARRARKDDAILSAAKARVSGDKIVIRRPVVMASGTKPTSGSLDVRFGPCVDGSWLARVFFTSQAWSVRPCVRPVIAAHGPLAIMPSADQVPVKSAHSTMHWPRWVVPIAGSTGSALRAVRPPNRHITPYPGAISSRRKCDGFLVTLALGHHGPGHSGNLVGECDSGDLRRAPRQQRC